MAIFLQVRAGPLGILLDALRVHEVVLLAEPLRGGQAFAPWRDQVLPVVRLASHLQLPGGEGSQAVVYAPAEGVAPAMLLVDEVMRLRQIGPGQWQGLPSVPHRTAALFDAVFWDAEAARQLFRLRASVEPQLLGVATASAQLSAPAPT